jgi:hypoxanthine-guanine phosphoribosyltransferase
MHLSNENWGSVLGSCDVVSTFLTSLEEFLKQISSPKQGRVSGNNEWITKDIKTSCKQKLVLYLNSCSSNNQTMKILYRIYSKVSARVIKEAKCMDYNKQILE